MEENMFTNPVLDGCADPDVIYYEGTYYLYATNTDMKDDSEMGFKVYTSKDLIRWHDAGMALKACDSWGEKQFWRRISSIPTASFIFPTPWRSICVSPQAVLPSAPLYRR